MHPLVKLAKDAVEHYVLHDKALKPPHVLIPEMREQAGVFVCLKQGGHLRGCIGTFQAVTDNVASEVIQNAVSAATRDPRFSPVTAAELDTLEYSVDVLTEPEKISSGDDLDPTVYGVIVKSGDRKGLLLPDLEGVNTVEEQVSIACGKAGISPGEDIELFRFKVHRYR